jgi:hypothetical protein
MNSKKETVEFIQHFLNIDLEKSEKLVEAFYQPAVPLKEKGVIKINPITHKAKTTKASNLTIDFSRLFLDSTDIGLSIFGTIEHSLLIPLAVILGLNKIWKNISIEISQLHAIVIEAIWRNMNRRTDSIVYSDALVHVNNKLRSMDQARITPDHFERIITELELLKILDKTNNTIEVRETVTFSTDY